MPQERRVLHDPLVDYTTVKHEEDDGSTRFEAVIRLEGGPDGQVIVYWSSTQSLRNLSDNFEAAADALDLASETGEIVGTVVGPNESPEDVMDASPGFDDDIRAAGL